MQELTLTQLKNKATELRIRVVDMIWKAQSGHPGGSLSVADFMTACYFRYMKVDPKNPRWADRDRFVLSKGHVCPAQYAALAMKGFFPMEVLDTLRKEGSPLQGSVPWATARRTRARSGRPAVLPTSTSWII